MKTRILLTICTIVAFVGLAMSQMRSGMGGGGTTSGMGHSQSSMGDMQGGAPRSSSPQVRTEPLLPN